MFASTFHIGIALCAASIPHSEEVGIVSVGESQFYAGRKLDADQYIELLLGDNGMKIRHSWQQDSGEWTTATTEEIAEAIIEHNLAESK